MRKLTLFYTKYASEFSDLFPMRRQFDFSKSTRNPLKGCEINIEGRQENKTS